MEKSEGNIGDNMKTIGLLGGMTAESSAEYYKLINFFTRGKLGGNHSAKSIMVSVDFGEMEPLMEKGEWDKLRSIMCDTALSIEKGGADFLVICTNTIHKFADHIEGILNIPVLNLIDAVAERIKRKGFRTIGLLGTRFTMEEDFYKMRLKEKHGIRSIIPGKDDREFIHKVIVDELSIGNFNRSSREGYIDIIRKLSDAGAEGVILGCTEIPLLVKKEDCNIPMFDTTTIHAETAVDLALST